MTHLPTIHHSLVFTYGIWLSLTKLYILAAQTPSSCRVLGFPILDHGFSLHPECHTITDQYRRSRLHRKGDKTFFSSLKCLFFYYVHVLRFVPGNDDVWRTEQVSSTLKTD